MDVVFFGTPEWAVVSLDALARSRHTLRGVVTAPDAPVGRSRAPAPPPVKVAAQRLGIGRVLQPDTLRGSAPRAAITSLPADVYAVVAYGRILPGRLLDAPRFGAVNLHFSLLPRHRGASPVQHTILEGDPAAGVSTIRMDRGLDTGPLLAQASTPVGTRESASRLGARLAVLGAGLLVETLDRLEAGAVVPLAQDESGASWAPVLSHGAGRLRWSETATEIDRRVRAFDPWPPVVCSGPKGPLRIVEAEPLDQRAPASVPPGTVLGRAGESIDVAAGGTTVLRVRVVQPAGSRAMNASSALAGRYFSVGERLGDGTDT